MITKYDLKKNYPRQSSYSLLLIRLFKDSLFSKIYKIPIQKASKINEIRKSHCLTQTAQNT